MNRPLRIIVVEPDRQRALEIVDAILVAGDHRITVLGEGTGLARRVAEVEPGMVLIDIANPSRDTLEELALASGSRDRAVAMFVDRSKGFVLRATRAERQEVVEFYLERVGLGDAMDRPAAEMSNGMRQRVGIARAFALSPKPLLLDEPFGMLDSLTRRELQKVLMEVWSRIRVSAICVTHDVDEAILLADRVVMMTRGPRATIGKITDVNLPRPRRRKALLDHPDYYHYRQQVLDFLQEHEHGRNQKDAA